MKPVLQLSYRDGQSILIVENTDTNFTANLEIIWIPYEPAGFIFLH